MNITCTRFSSPTCTFLSTIRLETKGISLRPYLISATRRKVSRKQCVALQADASFSCPPIDVDNLASEYGIDGVSFSGISDSCVIRMALDNGSVATVILPSGLITSFKVPLWHGGTTELLHTVVSEGGDGGGAGGVIGGAVIQGGISVALECKNERGLWSPNTWRLDQVKGTPQESIQLQLSSRNSEENLEVKHLINLQQDVLSSDILVSNISTSTVELLGSILSHLTVSTPEATYAVGLEGSDFFSRPPVSANFTIIPPEPDFAKRKDKVSTKFWGLFVNQNKEDDDLESYTQQDLNGEETENYKNLTDEMSRIYTSAPRNFTIIDRGRRNSVVLRRDGFDELYMYSPGSRHTLYGRYSYVCLGQAALLKPVSLNSQSEWRGGLHLHNPNM